MGVVTLRCSQQQVPQSELWWDTDPGHLAAEREALVQGSKHGARTQQDFYTAFEKGNLDEYEKILAGTHPDPKYKNRVVSLPELRTCVPGQTPNRQYKGIA